MAAIVLGACGGGGGHGTGTAANPAPTAPVAGQQAPDVTTELTAVDDGLNQLDADLQQVDSGLATDEGDPSR